MKRTMTLIVILALCAAAVSGAIAALAFEAGRRSGIQHAIMDSTIFTVEIYDPEHPHENAREDGTDQTIFFELDGETYERGMYQG